MKVSTTEVHLRPIAHIVKESRQITLMTPHLNLISDTPNHPHSIRPSSTGSTSPQN